jgi:hypothetical protein
MNTPGKPSAATKFVFRCQVSGFSVQRLGLTDIRDLNTETSMS